MKIHNVVAVLLTLGSVLCACSKDPSIVTKEFDSTNKHDKLFRSSIQYSVEAKDLNTEISNFIENSPGKYLRITPTPEGYLFEQNDVFDNDETPSEIVCSGSGSIFIKCVTDFLEGHPACDIVICPDSSGSGFYADSFCP
jgi:hypothetical protein